MVVQEVLLFGKEAWVMNPQLYKALEGFQHLAVRQMAGMGPKRQRNGTCVAIFVNSTLILPLMHLQGVRS